MNSGAGQVANTGFRPDVREFESPRLQYEEKPMATARVLSFVVADQAEPEMTHEAFVSAVRDIVVGRVPSEELRDRLLGAKLVYGGGPAGVRGLCYFGAWQNGRQHDFLEIAALGEESYVQLAGTTIHELAHSLAGPGAGHGRDWKRAAVLLGLSTVEAGGQAYAPDQFEPSVWAAIEALPHPSDGQPQFHRSGAAPTKPARPCPLGIGTRGGRSRGAGSGSRLRLWVCSCGIKVRVARDEFRATCDDCGSPFQRKDV
jgi:hypothetical protein